MLVPTRELAAQVTAEIGTIAPAHDLRVAAVYGGVSISAQAKASRDAHILVATPSRLQDLIERKIVSLDGVRMLILDEADRMLDMGFQPQVDRIVARLPASAADDVLLRHARRPGRRARAGVHDESRPLRGRADDRPAAGARSTTSSCR